MIQLLRATSWVTASAISFFIAPLSLRQIVIRSMIFGTMFARTKIQRSILPIVVPSVSACAVRSLSKNFLFYIIFTRAESETSLLRGVRVRTNCTNQLGASVINRVLPNSRGMKCQAGSVKRVGVLLSDINTLGTRDIPSWRTRDKNTPASRARKRFLFTSWHFATPCYPTVYTNGNGAGDSLSLSSLFLSLFFLLLYRTIRERDSVSLVSHASGPRAAANPTDKVFLSHSS